MPGTLVAEPLFASPFLRLKERMMPGDPGTPLEVYPKLPATPKRLKAAKSMTKLVMQTDIRIEELPAIGNPVEAVPTVGIRVIHWNDRWVLFGNTGTNPPRLYERTGPVYTRTDAYPSGDWPTNTSFVYAAFSKAGRFMYAVKANDLQNVQVYQWSGATETSPDGEWELKTPLALGTNIAGLEISPLNNFLIVKTATAFKLFDIQNLNAVVAPASLPVGDFLTMSPTEEEWIVAILGGNVNVYNFNTGTRVFALDHTLAGSTGTLRRARYSPDGLVLALNGRPTSGTGMPKFYARSSGDWTVVTTGSHAGATTWDVSDFAFKDDSSQVFYTHSDGGQKAEFLNRATVVPDVFVDAAGNPYAAGGAPLTGGRPVRDGAGLHLATMTGAWTYDATAETYTSVTPSGFATSIASVDISRDGLWMLKNTTAALTFWGWSGSAWIAATAPAATGGNMRGVSLSADGQRCAVAFNQVTTNNGFIRIFERNAGTGVWTQVGADIALGTTDATNVLRTCPIWHPTRSDILVLPGTNIVGTLVQPRFFRLISGTWTETPSAFPYLSGYNVAFWGAVWTAAGDFLLMISRSSTAGDWRLHVFAFDTGANTFSLDQTVSRPTSSTGAPQHLQISPDQKIIAWATTTTSPLVLFANTGTDADPTWAVYANPSSTSATTLTGVLWSAEFLATFANAAASPNYWRYNQFFSLPSYTVTHTFTAPSGSGLPPMDGYDSSQEIANFGGSGWAEHPYTDSFTPVTYPTALAFAPQYAITAVWGHQLSDSRKVVLYQTATGIGIATRDNLASSYINAETLRACFVQLYDRTGDTFNERSYSMHLIDSIVKDFQFSPNEEVLAYHVDLPVGAPGGNPQGRLLYDISLDKFEFRGQVWEADMTNSLMAFSPFSTEFVVTHEHADTHDPVITLHEFGVNYVFSTQDTKAVEFGPPDFSACNDVVVAHGGSPPMSFFVHDDPGNVLTPNPVTIDWDYVGVILAIAFRDDCEGLVVVTPDEITVLEPGEEDWEEQVTEELDEPLEPPDDPDEEWPDVEWNPPDIKIIKDNEPGPTYPGEWDYTGKDLNNISYVPYSVFSVTFRVASVAE